MNRISSGISSLRNLLRGALVVTIGIALAAAFSGSAHAADPQATQFSDLPIGGVSSSGGLAWQDMTISLGGKECDVLKLFNCRVTDLVTVRVRITPSATTSYMTWTGVYEKNETGNMDAMHLQFASFLEDGRQASHDPNYGPVIGSGEGYLEGDRAYFDEKIGIGVKLWVSYPDEDYVSSGLRTPLALCEDGSGQPPAAECRFG